MGRGRRSHRWRYWQLALMAILMALSLTLGMPDSSSYGQPEEIPTETVVVDGRPLFQVTKADPINAQERAETINEELADWVTSDESIDVEWELRNGLPVILINDRYLMTVNQTDAEVGGEPSVTEQAITWQIQLEQALQQAQEERSQEFVWRALVASLIVLLATALLHRALGYFWRHTLRPLMQSLTLADQGPEERTGINVFLRFSLFLVRLGLWGGALFYVTNRFPLTRRWSYLVFEGIVDGFITRNLQLGDKAFSILDLLVLMGLLLALVLVSSTVTNLLRSRVLHVTGINRGAQEAVAILVKYSLIFIGTVVILQVWGLDLSSLALIASALGVGIGLGLQNIAKDFGSGLVLVFERPIQVGEFVEFGEFKGTVERIGARSTEIKTLDQVSIIVPNSRFLEQEVINWSHRNPTSRIRLPVGVAYASDPQAVRQALMEASHRHPGVLSTPPPQVFFGGFGDSALEFELLVWIRDPSQQLLIRSDLYFAIETALRRHNIEIPFPQRDLHLRTGSLPVDLSPEMRQWLAGWASRSNGDRGSGKPG
ncbi:putative small conductance mechanosensitive Ion Channel [Halomicronema hongdechloris C2206]|uniref:Small conductance mechanosensitive Ion Channel n=1 Tax=Halomicronema hongdechloris C2206 TaxID=1641165 RepID=A0A1Z3HGD2_9CYAN|nr:mechanosensitive ion channel domain-containing protein [Halomicronema hongdechloris]ASC69338.1 putative small conductance mechanosensitive Ion Channel [Halomicronema hongdechloris C2206]